MNSAQSLLKLFEAMNALVEIPVMKLAENQTLKQEIQSIISSKNISSIVNDIQNEHMQRAYNEQSKAKLNAGSLLQSYVKYQGAAHNYFATARNVAGRSLYSPLYTEPVTTEHVRAFNQKNENPMRRSEIRDLRETREFIEVFNSIYSDHSLQIGTANDPTRISSYIDYSPYIYNYQYYISIPTLSQTVDLPINIATRKMPELLFTDRKLGKKIETHLRRTRFNEKIKKMLFYSSLSPRGALIVPILENGKVRFNVFNDTQFTYATSQQYSKIDFKDNTAGVSQLFCLGHLLQNEVTAHFLCPGFEPIFAIGKNRIFQLKDAAEAINIYLYTIKVLCIRAQVIFQTWDGEGQNDTLLAQMRKLTDNINSSLSLSTAQKVPKGSTVDILNNNLSPGFAEVSPIIKEFQGMLSGVMPDYFYGSSTAYNANAFNLQVTHQNIRSQVQEAQIEPIYRYCINFLLQYDVEFKQYSSEIGNFDTEFPSLYEPTETEKAETNSKIIDNLIKMHDYPELEKIFKKEGVLREEHNINGKVDNPEEKDEGT